MIFALVPEEEQDDDIDTEGDSDDETPGLEGARPNDEMTIHHRSIFFSAYLKVPYFNSEHS